MSAVGAKEDAAETGEGLRVLTFDPIAYPNANVAELSMLETFAELLRTLQPDVLFSYNGNAFDNPFIRGRLNFLLGDEEFDKYDDYESKIAPYSWGRVLAGFPKHVGAQFTPEEQSKRERERESGRKVLYDPCRFDSPGLAQHDALEFGRSLNLESAKLDDVAEHVLGTKIDPRGAGDDARRRSCHALDER